MKGQAAGFFSKHIQKIPLLTEKQAAESGIRTTVGKAVRLLPD